VTRNSLYLNLDTRFYTKKQINIYIFLQFSVWFILIFQEIEILKVVTLGGFYYISIDFGCRLFVAPK